MIIHNEKNLRRLSVSNYNGTFIIFSLMLNLLLVGEFEFIDEEDLKRRDNKTSLRKVE